MSALVKVTLAGRLSNHMRLQLLDGVDARGTRSGLGVELSGPRILTSAGEPFEGTAPQVLKAGQRVGLSFGTALPKQYHLLLDCAPALAAHGQPAHQRIAEPEETVDLTVWFRAERPIDVSALPWALRLYLLD